MRSNSATRASVVARRMAARLAPVDRPRRVVLEPAEQLDRGHGQPCPVGAGPHLAHQPGRLARRGARQLTGLDQLHVPVTGLHQVVEHGATDGAATDDGDLCIARAGQRPSRIGLTARPAGCLPVL